MDKELNIGISVPIDLDQITISIDNLSENDQHRLLHQLHKKLITLSQTVPHANIRVAEPTSELPNLYIQIENLGPYSERLKFEKFLYQWLPIIFEEIDL